MPAGPQSKWRSARPCARLEWRAPGRKRPPYDLFLWAKRSARRSATPWKALKDSKLHAKLGCDGVFPPNCWLSISSLCRMLGTRGSDRWDRDRIRLSNEQRGVALQLGGLAGQGQKLSLQQNASWNNRSSLSRLRRTARQRRFSFKWRPSLSRHGPHRIRIAGVFAPA